MRALIVAALLLAGCSKVCQPGTILLSYSVPSAAALASVRFTVLVDGVAKVSTVQTTHASGSVEVTFPRGYPKGKQVQATVEALDANGDVIASGSSSVTPANGCELLSVSATVGSGDMATNDISSPVDQSGADLFVPADQAVAPDMSGVDLTGADLSPVCTNGDRRCHPTDHSIEELCVSGQWQDTSCMSVAAPPIYACTEAKNRCVDTGWVQWSYVDFPNPRFDTLPDPAAGTEDVIRDRWTGLYWQTTLEDAKYIWGTQAQSHCDDLTYGGFSDWRLPSPIELSTLVDRSVGPGSFPRVLPAFMSTTKAEPYYTSTKHKTSGGTFQYAWVIDFSVGNFTDQNITNAARVRCVR